MICELKKRRKPKNHLGAKRETTRRIGAPKSAVKNPMQWRKCIHGVRQSASLKGGDGLFATQLIKKNTIICSLRKEAGVRVEMNSCPSCCLIYGIHNPRAMAEVLSCIDDLIKPGSCEELRRTVSVVRSEMPTAIMHLQQYPLLQNTVERVCRTFCCEQCDMKHPASTCYPLRNAWTVFSGHGVMVYQTMEKILDIASSGKDVIFGLDPAHHTEPIRLINEPSTAMEENAMFVDKHESRQTKTGQLRKKLLVVTTCDIQAGEEICASYGEGYGPRDYMAWVKPRVGMMIDNKLLIEVSGKYEIHTVANGPCVNFETEERATAQLVKAFAKRNMKRQTPSHGQPCKHICKKVKRNQQKIE